MNNYALWFTEEVARCAREGHAAMCRLGGGEWYLYYKTLSIVIAQEKPEGYTLATGERVLGNRTVQGLTAWVHTNTSRLPVLPGD